MLEALLALDHRGVALEMGDSEVSYAELGERAGAVRDSLTEQGLGPGHLVALVMTRDLAGVAGLIGCLQAGACALPLCPGDPPARLEHLLSLARPSAILSHGKGLRPVRDLLQRGAPLPVCLEIRDSALPRALEGGGNQPMVPLPKTGGLAFITAGPRARPRGIFHARATLDLQLTWAMELLGARATDRTLARCPLDRPGIILELLLPLATGGTACLAPLDPPPGPLTLPLILEQRRISLAHLDSSLGARVADAARKLSLPALRHLLLSGPTPRSGWLAPLMAALPGAMFHALASHAELPILAHQILEHGLTLRDPLPSGSAGPGLEVTLTGRALQPCSPGDEGEVWVSGPALPLGHLNDPRLDGQLFIHRAKRRYMRTRQRAYEDAAGSLVLLGRSDRQVQVGDRYVDLAEVERCLGQCPGVTAAAVVALPHHRDGNHLAALVRGRRHGEATLCLERCTRLLPAYMVPARALVMERLPRTKTGAVDQVRVEMMLSEE